MLMARLALQSERWGDAAKSWLEVLREDIAEPDHRAAKLGLMALSDPARARFLIPHLTAAETDPRRGVWILQYAQSFPDDPLGPYLYGRWLYNQGDHRSAAEAFLRAVGRRFPGEAFERENLLRLVVSSFLAGELDICGAALQRLEDSPSRPGFRLLVNDWKERLAWARSHQNDDAGYPLGK
ncbi:MAG: hypothetical protein GMKNLPBB_02999 [Myxococcota bacterium]|nr:hypothetical protein [Myxococcota bacterium]